MVIACIEIKKHLVEYLNYKYLVENHNYIDIPHSDDLYYVLNNLRSKRPINVLVNTGNLMFRIPYPRGGRDPDEYNHYSQDAIATIQSRINWMFKAEFHDLMDYRVDECGDALIEATILFMNKYKVYSIESDSLSKDYYRWRKKHRAQRKVRAYCFQNK